MTAEEFPERRKSVKTRVCLARSPSPPPCCDCLFGSRPSLTFREGNCLGSYFRFRSRSVILLAYETLDGGARLRILVGLIRHPLTCWWHRTIVARNVAAPPTSSGIQNNDARGVSGPHRDLLSLEGMPRDPDFAFQFLSTRHWA